MNGKKALPKINMPNATHSSYANIAYYHSHDVRSVIISNARFVAALVCSEQPCHMGKCTNNPIHGFECECGRKHMGRRCEIREYARCVAQYHRSKCLLICYLSFSSLQILYKSNLTVRNMQSCPSPGKFGVLMLYFHLELSILKKLCTTQPSIYFCHPDYVHYII